METKAGVFGGTLLVVILHLHPDELLNTVVLGVIGAIVSFSVTHVMKFFLKRFRK